MSNLILIVNDGNCKAMRLKGGKINAVRIAELPKDLTGTLNKYMVSDQLDFDLRDPDLDRSNLELTKGSLEDKRMKMADDALSAIEPLAKESGGITILTSNRYIGKLRKKMDGHNFEAQIDEFVPSGANKAEENESIVRKMNTM